MAQLTGVLSDARDSLKKVDAVLAEAQAIGANTRVATADLGALRAEVDAACARSRSWWTRSTANGRSRATREIKLP